MTHEYLEPGSLEHLGRAARMAYLIENWGDAYIVWDDAYFEDWRAVPRGGPIEDPIVAPTASGLLLAIRADYGARTIGRGK